MPTKHILGLTFVSNQSFSSHGVQVDMWLSTTLVGRDQLHL